MSGTKKVAFFLRSTRFMVATLLLIACLASCANPAATDAGELTGAVSGYVRYAGQSDNSGIAVVAERIEGEKSLSVVRAIHLSTAPAPRATAAQTFTDASGAYTLNGLAEGSYTIYAGSQNSLEKAVRTGVTVTVGETVTALDLDLTPIGNISGKATLSGASGGNLGILIYIAGTSYSAMTDDTGNYIISGVPAGTGYVLVATSVITPGYSAAMSTAEVTAFISTEAAAISLSPKLEVPVTGSLSGTVRLDGATSGNAGAIVFLAGSSVIAATVDSGSFLLTGIPPGTYTLMASKENYGCLSVCSVTVDAGSSDDVGIIVLSRSAGPAVTVSFDARGGTAVASQTLKWGALAVEPAAPTLSGSALVGWYKEASCENRWDWASDAATADTILYAKWTAATEGLSFTADGVDYIVAKGSANTAGSIVIPDYWAGRKVTVISENGFQACTTLVGATIPVHLSVIGANAFQGCTALKSITLPDGLASIGSYAFQGCTALSSVSLPDSVTVIGAYAFKDCESLQSVAIPNGVTALPGWLFYGCGALSSVTLPSGLKSIGQSAFSDCAALTGIVFPDGLTSIGSSAFLRCTSLTAISLPDGITSISDMAFCVCGALTSVNLPDGLKSIGYASFGSCASLESVAIPSGVTSIGMQAFEACTKLSSFTIPPGISSISTGVFSGCTALSSVSIPSNVTAIGDKAFSGCLGLATIALPPGLSSIGTYAFSNSGLTSITIPAGVKTMTTMSFGSCKSLSSVTLPSGLTMIDTSAFGGSSALKTIAIPTSVTSIGTNAFSNSGLMSITIPIGVKTLGIGVFARCEALTIVYANPVTPPATGEALFNYCSALSAIKVPGASVSAYKVAAGWSMYTNKIVSQ